MMNGRYQKKKEKRSFQLPPHVRRLLQPVGKTELIKRRKLPSKSFEVFEDARVRDINSFEALKMHLLLL